MELDIFVIFDQYIAVHQTQYKLEMWANAQRAACSRFLTCILNLH